MTEYNQGWNYFEGLSAEDAAKREADDLRDASGFANAKHYGWGMEGDGTRSRDEMHALSVLELESDADFEAIKASWRRLAKANHPDVKPGDAQAAVRFQSVQAAFEVLSSRRGTTRQSIAVALTVIARARRCSRHTMYNPLAAIIGAPSQVLSDGSVPNRT